MHVISLNQMVVPYGTSEKCGLKASGHAPPRTIYVLNM